jgi:hypothetical protein
MTVSFASRRPLQQAAAGPLRARHWLPLVLIAGAAFANHACGANPPENPQSSPVVKGFDVPGPGFGVTAHAAVSVTARRDQVPRGAKDVHASVPKETGETAATDPKDPLPSKPYRVRSPYERASFPSGVPEWFKQRDADFDGQVFMWEYAGSWTDEAARSFNRLDANGDGVITARESLVRRDVEVAPSRGFSATFRRTNIPSPITKVRVAESTAAPVTLSSPIAEKVHAAALPPTQLDADPSPAPHAIPQAFVAYADGVIKRFDSDHDGVLTAEEWTAMPAPPSTADADGNGQITTSELAVWYVRKR